MERRIVFDELGEEGLCHVSGFRRRFDETLTRGEVLVVLLKELSGGGEELEADNLLLSVLILCKTRQPHLESSLLESGDDLSDQATSSIGPHVS